MDYFNYKNQQLFAENVDCQTIANDVKTPCYVYSRQTLERHYSVFDEVLNPHPHMICYAVKANSNLAVLNLLARMGSGFDIVSGGELQRVLSANGDPAKVVFSGVGKTEEEMAFALQHQIHCFNVESEPELHVLQAVAKKLDVIAPIALRINPDVDAGAHPYIATGLSENKFGIDVKTALTLYQQANDMSHIAIKGIACHIGSQLTDLAPFLDALDRVLAVIEKLSSLGIVLEHIDLGGGLGVRYRDETPPEPADYAAAIRERLQDCPLKIMLEPGRAIAANAGILLTKVDYIKKTESKNFAIVDAAMNDLLRPALYQAEHAIVPVKKQEGDAIDYDIVGPVCETGDFLAKQCALNLQVGDLLAIRTAGAYGFVMSSNYNSRPRAAEVMVDGDHYHIVRRRETMDDLLALESVLDD